MCIRDSHRISAGVEEGPADFIRIAEVRAVLKTMKRHKARGLSGLVAEMIQATGDTGTQWILDLCNGIVKEGCMKTTLYYLNSTRLTLLMNRRSR